jgi:hypothetical protein
MASVGNDACITGQEIHDPDPTGPLTCALSACSYTALHQPGGVTPSFASAHPVLETCCGSRGAD